MINQNQVSDFSIDHILNRAGNGNKNEDCRQNFNQISLDPYSWLQCTRYCPPKVARSQRKEMPQKRQLGRHPRIPFTTYQLSVLEEKFQQSPYLSSEEVICLSRKLQLADIRVKIWFQNRRARERREKNTTDGEDQEIVLIKQEPSSASSSSSVQVLNLNFLNSSSTVTSGALQSYFSGASSSFSSFSSTNDSKDKL